MDYPQLSTQLVQFLAPFLPYLVKGLKLAGQEAARKPGEKAGAEICADNARIRVRLQPTRRVYRKGSCPSAQTASRMIKLKHEPYAGRFALQT